MDKLEVGGGERRELLGVAPNFGDEPLGNPLKTPQDLVEEVVRRNGGDVPSEASQEEELPRQHLLVRDGIVRVENQFVGC